MRPHAELRVDRIACDGPGLCAELFPERIALDEWGFPLVVRKPIPPSLEAHARRAVTECPKCALRLVSVEAAPSSRARRAGSRARP